MESSNYMLSEMLGVTHGLKKFYVSLIAELCTLNQHDIIFTNKEPYLKKCSLHFLSLRFLWDAADTVNKSIEFYEILIVTNF